MLRVFLASHAHLASGLQSAVELLAGIGDRLFVCDAYVDGGTFDVSGALNDFLADAAPDDQILLLSDLYGGSVNQAMFTYLDRPNTRLVSGVNMSFMMNVLSEDTLSDERLDEIIEESREYLRRVEPEVPADTAPTGSDDFF